MSKPKYLWLDLETNGLDPYENTILECAAFATDAELNLIDDAHVDMVLHSEASAYDAADTFVQDMHTTNKLWEACWKSKSRASDLSSGLIELITSYEWLHGRPVLAGASVHFDRGFIRAYLPTVDKALHHRHYDVSVLKMATVDVGLPVHVGTAPPAHRSMRDIVQSLGEARAFARALSLIPQG